MPTVDLSTALWISSEKNIPKRFGGQETISLNFDVYAAIFGEGAIEMPTTHHINIRSVLQCVHGRDRTNVLVLILGI